ncbi:MAG: long-chain fatty acid--CoA ligase [Acidaminococcaceae bacterium]
MLYFEIIQTYPSEKKALIFKEQVTTYGQLREQVRKWANFLQAQGVQKGDKIGLLSKNCADFVVAYFAITQAGAVVVPLNFQLTAREVAYIVRDAKLKALVGKQPVPALEEALAEAGYAQPVVQLTYADLARPTQHEFRTPDLVDSDNCTIIYTSGTTGKPKGAMLSHQNLVTNARDFTKVVRIEANDIALCVLPMYHCFAWTVAVSGQLLHGACIVIQETYLFKDTMKLLAQHRVNAFIGVPTMMQFFVNGALPEELTNIRYFISGGSALPRILAEAFKKKFGKFVQEGYGLSEAAPVVTVNPPEKIKIGSIGLPLPGVEVSLQTAEGTPLATGEVGELCVRGPNVMLGYLNLPAATTEALRGGWLHTEDLAYQDSEGYLFIVDRLKDMIISSGENVYPREIEEVLYTHPQIAEVAVIGVPDKLRGQAICAYLVLKEGAQLTKSAVRKFLLARIAAYKVPREFLFCQQMPKSATGKILKTALREQALVDLLQRKH